jgi:serine/threonine protein kinase/tetratricopeptide (TPR) repeat protein
VVSELPSEDGEHIGPYRIVKVLGRGGMGEVFLAWDPRLNRSVAIKRIRHDSATAPILRQRLLKEAQAVGGLQHPAIVLVYDLLEDDGDDCIVMEYIQGSSLAERLNGGGPLEPALAVHLAGEIASGLAAAHGAGIIHRDLKAENVMITPADSAKILDFGLAKPIGTAAGDSSLTAVGCVMGTCRSMSPEQARGAEVDERSDLFSLGVVLYEMLTGISPFQGANALETLSKVISERPPCLDTLRPGLPPRLIALLVRLLAKEPDARPVSASEVGRELHAIAAALSPTEDFDPEETVSDLPTIVDFPLPDNRQLVSRSQAVPASTVSPSASPWGLKTAAVTVLAVAMLGVLTFLLARAFLADRKPRAPAASSLLRVVVLRPQVNGKGEQLQLAASGVLTTSLSTLSALAGVDAIGQTQLVGSPATLQETAKAAAADELLVAILDEAGERARITLRRQAPDGQTLWAETFAAPIEADSLLQLAKTVDQKLLRGYGDRHLRRGTLTLEARTEDYAAFLGVRHRLDTGAVPSQDDLDRLQQVMDKSPGFLDAHLLAANVLVNRFQSTRKVAYRERAMDLVRGARQLAPDDPRPLLTQFRIELVRDEPWVAAKTLERIETLLPGDPRVLVLRSNLADREGRADEALKDLEKAVQASPTWPNLNSLATLEANLGHVEEARGHLNQILAGSRNNVFALDSLARLELLFGDLHEAERRYQELIARTSTPQRAHYTNLGNAQVLLGHYREAIATFHKALEIDADNVGVNLNLAEAELALGRTKDAKTHFWKALHEIEKNPVPENSLSQAQCLAHLGRRRDAVKIIWKELERKRDDPDVLQSAALVFTLVGDHSTALANVEKALQKGIQPRWFLLPGFDSLRDDPEFRDLIRKAPGAPR